MARALLGHLGPAHDQILALEIGRLRRRVAELETELARLKDPVQTVDLDTVDLDTVDLDTVDVANVGIDDLELRRMTEGLSEPSQPALA